MFRRLSISQRVVGAMLLLVPGCSMGGGPARSLGAGPASSTLALTNATVVDVHTGQLRPRLTVIVSGNHITAADETSAVQIPAEARVVDASGKYLIPGLTDTHVHVLSEWANPPVEASAYFGWILAGGVTSLREMSRDGFERALALRADANAGRVLAPRIHVSAGPDPARPDPWGHLLQFTGTRDPAAAVRRFPTLGIAGLKLQNFPRDTMLKLIDVARTANVRVYGHTVFASPDRPPVYDNVTIDLVRAGLNGVVHSVGARPMGVDNRSAATMPRTTAEGRRAWRLYNLGAWRRTNEADTQALIDMMVGRGVWYEPTLLVDYYWNHQDLYDTVTLSLNHPWRTREQSLPDAELGAAVLAFEAAEARFVRRFHEAGGIVLAGTDEVPFPPFGVSEEMRLLVDAGLPPLAALQAATINPARAMGWDDRLGSMEVGKLADLVLLDANPLDDITNVRKIHAVVADGRLLDRATLDEFLRRVGTPIEAAAER